MQPANMAYDRAITVFSPDGRLFQVEYAREAVKRGTTAVGVKFKDGVILAIDKRIASKLVEASSIEKIFQVDEHVGCASSGLVSDARVLVDRARVEAQINRLYYDEAIGIETLVKKICDFKQTYTQYGGVRPFGTALLVAGVDDSGIYLFETDPSGALMAYRAGAIGEGRNTALSMFESKYRDGMGMDEAVSLSLDALRPASEDGSLSSKTVEIGVIKRDENFRKLSAEDVQKYIDRIKKKG